MNYLFLLIALFFQSFLWAQQETHFSKKNSINLSSGLALGHRLEGADFKLLKNRSTKEYIPAIDIPSSISLNFRFGVDYQRQLIQNLSIKVGARFANWNLAYKINQPMKEKSNDTYLSIEIPLTVNYKFGNKKLQPYVEVGASPMFFLSNKLASNYSASPNFSIAVHAGVGLSYQFTENFALFGQVSSRFQMESFHIFSTMYDDLIYPYEISLEFGTAFSF